MCELSGDSVARRWGGIAPCEHVVQMYEDADRLMDSLEEFVCDGLSAEDGVVVVATMAHLFELERRLRANRTFQFATMQSRGRYVRLNAHEALWQFMVHGMPDEKLFRAFVDRVIGDAGNGGRRVRAFGEMVAVLWSQGNVEATKALERIWHRVCQERGLALYCAYPRSVFKPDERAAMDELCGLHSRVLAS